MRIWGRIEPLDRKTGIRDQGTGIREQGTGIRKQETGNREQARADTGGPAARPALAELGRGTRIVGVGKLGVGHPPANGVK
jgi:hypothetical protein